MLDRILLVATIVGGAVIGLVLPTHRSPQPAADQAISIAKSSDGQFYADAAVNGNSTHFLIDTGASEIALSEADAEAAGIKFNPAEYQLIGDGASGVVRGQQVRIARLDLGSIHETNVDAVVVPGTSVSLLGEPFLDRLDEIVIKKDQMEIRYSGS